MTRSAEWFVFITAVAFYIIINSGTDTIDVTISQGKLKGKVLTSRNGTKYYGFFGIPFAKPPVGDLRFEPPQMPDSWDGIRDATNPPPPCIQKNSFAINSSEVFVFGQEDCLYLNVFSPPAHDRLLPTLVYIHGGAFNMGMATFTDPNYFMDNAVVMVFVQYRLHVLGFLSAADNILPGNYGLKDQTAALKWVRDNIRAFGGDPKKVTLFGESAGGASVHLHMHSPLSKGLFQKAISQSGTALAPWAQISPDAARERAVAVGLLAGCPTKSTRLMVNCLKNVPAEELLEIHHKFYVWDIVPNVLFPPVVEPKSVEGAFLTENPWKKEVVNSVPWMVGFTSGEGGLIASRYFSNDGQLASYLDKHYERLFPLLFSYGYWTEYEKALKVSKSIRKYYFGDEEIGFKTVNNLVKLIGFIYFESGSIEAAARYTTNKLYFYIFDHRQQHSFNEVFGTTRIELGTGVCHVDDLISLFYFNIFPKVTSGADLEVSKRVINYWVNFAYHSDPNGDETVWRSTKPDDLEYLHITTNEDKMEKKLPTEQQSFWKNLEAVPQYSASDIKIFKDEL